jgi:phosphatidylserine decarboxylase
MSGVFAAWREVRAIVVGLVAVSGLAWLLKGRWLAVAAAGLLGWVFYFFRDPERIPAAFGPAWILSPADGKVTHIDLVDEPHFFGGQVRRISIFLSLFDVHVQRTPYQGKVKFLRYESGDFAPAFLKDTHSNESNFIGLKTPRGLLGVRQIVGILARRIVCWPELDEVLITGQRFGLIKFGSRVELYLPPDVEVLTYIGQQVHAGQSVVARWTN